MLPLAPLLALGLLAAPRVQLVTMGESPLLYERFGHAALRVTDGSQDLVYNFGATDFRRRDLVAAFLRGHVRFWVQVTTWQKTLDAYRRGDRTIWLQDLNLAPDQHARLAAELARLSRPELREYDYDHFTENCTTRVRDLIDQASGGALRTQLQRPVATTYRELAQEGFAGAPLLQLGVDLLVGSPVDRPLSEWETGFLPKYLRRSIQTVKLDSGMPLGSAPQLLYERRGPANMGSPHAGRTILFALSMLLLLLSLITPRAPRLAKGLRIGWAIGGGLLGCGLLAFAAYSTLPLLRQNPNLLLFWPLDLLLLFLSARLCRQYGLVRLVSVWAVLALLQPPLAVFTFATAGTVAALGPSLRARKESP